jgi:optic atrophy 3 protein
MAETWRSSRNNTKRREDVDDRILDLQAQMQSLTEKVDAQIQESKEKWEEQESRCVPDNLLFSIRSDVLTSLRTQELIRILENVVEIGMRNGMAELQDTPLSVPRIQINHRREQSSSPLDTPRLVSDNASDVEK